MKKYALDTVTISYLLKEDPTVSARLKKESDAGNLLSIPLMAYYEVKRGLLAVQATRKMSNFERLCDTLGVGALGFDVLDRAAHIYANLRSAGRLIDDADIILAAFCLVNDCILVTDNVQHFDRIDGLQHENWVIR